MPVINLPRDTRGSELGTAIAGATKSLTDAYMSREAATGVADIMADPSVPEAQKGVKALKEFGDQGYEFFKKFQQTQLMEAQAKNLLADAGLATVRTALGSKELGTAEAMAQAKLATQQAQPALVQSQTKENLATAASTTALTDPRVAALNAQTAENQANTATTNALRDPRVAAVNAQTGNVQQQTQESQTLLPGKVGIQETTQTAQKAAAAQSYGEGLKSVPEKGILEEKLKQLQNQGAALQQGATTLDAIARAAGVSPESADGQLAKSAYINEPDPAKKWAAYSSIIEKAVTRNAEIAKPTLPTPSQEERMVAAERQVVSAEKFNAAFQRGGAQKIGWWDKAAPAQAFLEQIGWGTGDPVFVDMFNSSLQSVADTAKQGSQFFSQGTVKLAKDITPNIAGTPLHAMLAANEVAERTIAGLRAQQAGMTPGQEGAKKQVDATIKRWEKVAADTKVESFTSTPWSVEVQRPDGGTYTQRITVKDSPNPPPPGQPVIVDGQQVGTVKNVIGTPGDAKSIVLWRGNQVDPHTFKDVMPANATFKVGTNTFTGAQIIEAAREAGVTPEAVLEGQRRKAGVTAPTRR